MKPTHRLNRRSFLGSVAGGMVGCGALAIVTGRAQAIQVTDSDTGTNADPVGRGRGRRAAAREPGDSDFANPQPMGDTFQSDPPPERRTGLTDRDSGPAADMAGHGAGRNRQGAQIARCAETRRRIARYEGMRPRTPDSAERLAILRGHLGRIRCP